MEQDQNYRENRESKEVPSARQAEKNIRMIKFLAHGINT